MKRIPTREELTIDPGPRSIQDSNKSGSKYHFDSGKFFKKKVYLGELRTDALGGRGVSASFLGHDDVSDGPVTAEVSVNGRAIPVEPAWVIAGPPNYAPQLKGGRTMYVDRPLGDGWLAVGDAALAFDPLSSQGIFTSLYTGIQAGEALAERLYGDADALIGYGDRLATIYDAYLRNRSTYYTLEKRWAGYPFWQRRAQQRAIGG